MRAVLFILIVAVVALLIAVATGLINVTQTRPAKAPDVSVNRTGVTAQGGQTPAFNVETGSVSVAPTQTNITVPTVKVVPPQQQPGGATNNAN